MILPTYAREAGGYLNFNEIAERWLRSKYHGQLPAISDFNDPFVAKRVLEEIHRALGWQWSYGGYLEDRSVLWRGSYLEKAGTFDHLGVDFNAPAGTPVATDRCIRVVDVRSDAPLKGGWGVHILGEILDLSHVGDAPIHLLFAHLDHDLICKVGDVLVPGTVFARIGMPDTNGWWYPHTHLQALSKEGRDLYFSNPKDFDGYGKREDVPKLVKLFPDPLRYVRFM